MGLSSGRAAIAICDRCSCKRPYQMLVADGNTPGLRVCSDRDCRDPFNPWRLPPIQPDNIILKFPRPDIPLWPPAQQTPIPLGAYTTEDGLEVYTTEDGGAVYVAE